MRVCFFFFFWEGGGEWGVVVVVLVGERGALYYLTLVNEMSKYYFCKLPWIDQIQSLVLFSYVVIVTLG